LPLLFWSCGSPFSASLLTCSVVKRPLLFWSCGSPFSASLLTRNVVKRPLLFWSCGSPFSASLLTRSVVKRPLLFWSCGSPFSALYNGAGNILNLYPQNPPFFNDRLFIQPIFRKLYHKLKSTHVIGVEIWVAIIDLLSEALIL